MTPKPEADPALVRESLNRILASEPFRRANRQSRFLQFIVEQFLQGRSAKESEIGTVVYGRPVDYDPKTDPIVRVEASRLRTRIMEYYAGAGSQDELQIEVPKGGYGPAFRMRNTLPAPAPAVAESKSLEKANATPVAAPESEPEKVRPGTAQKAPPAAPVGLLDRIRSKPALGVAGICAIAISGFGLWRFSAASESPLLSKPGAMVRITTDKGVTLDPDITPDGSMLVYSSDRETKGPLAVYVQPTAGGEPRRLTHDEFDSVEPAIEPGGKWVAYVSRRPGGGIFVISTNGGTPRIVASNGSRPRVSPDGRSILFSTTDPRGDWGRIWVVNADGGPPHRIVPEFATAISPVWAEDGKSILFYGTWQSGGPPERERDFWVAPYPGGEPQKLGLIPARPTKPHAAYSQMRAYSLFSWVGGAFYFCGRQGDNDEIWRQRLRGTAIEGEPEHLASVAGGIDRPAVSHDRIYFTNGSWDADIVSVPVDKPASMDRVISSSIFTRAPSVTRDESRIAYLADFDTRRVVFWRDLISGKDTAVRIESLELDYPTLSRDGKQLALRAMLRPEVPIFLVQLDSGKTEKVCDDCGGPMDWTPDGKYILFEPGSSTAHIGLLDLATRKPDILLKHPDYSLRSARFSPDGRWIAFHAEITSSRRQIFVSPWTGKPVSPSDWRLITTGQTRDINPAWSADGKTLYFLSDRDGFSCVWSQKMDPRTGKAEGDAIAFHHQHSTKQSIAIRPGTSYKSLGPAVGTKRVFLSAEDASANIWALTLVR